MQKIVNTESYMVAVDVAKNRIYCTMTGNDQRPEMSTFVLAWIEAARLTSRGFTVLYDASQVEAHNWDLLVNYTYIRKMLLEAKSAVIAEVFPERLAAKLKSSAIKKIFINRNEAEGWLDAMNP